MSQDRNPPSEDRESLDDSVRRGGRWALATHLVGQLATAVALVVVCRFLAPGEFGVFSTALLIVVLPRTFATIGFGAAIVQRERLEEAELGALFWWNLTASVASGAVSAAIGWGVAHWAGDPRLVEFAGWLAGTSLLTALGATHQALLERKLALPAVQRARLTAQLVGAVVSVGAATAGAGAGALVAQQYAELGLLALLAWRAEPWRPGRPRGWSAARGLVRFGGHVSLTNLVFHLGQNFDKLLLYVAQGSTESGRAALGAYSLAFNWMMKPVLLVTTPAAAVMLPALSRAAARPDVHARLVVRFLRTVAIALFPAGVGLFVVAPDAARVVAGDGWGMVGELLRALAPVIVAQGLINVCGSILSSTGRTGRLLAGATIVSIVLVQGAAAGFWMGGLFGDAPEGPTAGVAWGVSLVTACVIAGPYLAYVLSQVGVPFGALARALVGPALAAMAMGVIVTIARRLGLAEESAPPAVRLVAQIALGVAAYGWLARREIRQALRHED